ncbi:uroporphyrinogen-III synthase [Amorphus orientalis]|uniref:Uroporphyrinogen-III synthase n=1 Tax=Amorphus orientalis TaxID=649198 RepID=A0AAE3VNJ6_9HYPH|nr:uroporphyrinogen-III synthase [Amorphus orientalis]MDQ0315183.1 uroporphyrinogen-III synthase [Amorphus orientalis]
MRLLVTRPMPQAEDTCRALIDAGHEVLLAPLMEIVTDETVSLDPGAADALVFSSRGAVRAVALHPQADRLKHLPVFCVGDATAEAARAIGFGQVRSAAGDLAALAQLIAALPDPVGSVLHLAGRERSGDLGVLLSDAGVSVETRIVYAAEKAERLPDEVVSALADRRIDGILSFSPRSAETMVHLAEKADVLEPLRAVRHYCLSMAVADVLRDAGAGDLIVADRPDHPALLAAVARA